MLYVTTNTNSHTLCKIYSSQINIYLQKDVSFQLIQKELVVFCLIYIYIYCKIFVTFCYGRSTDLLHVQVSCLQRSFVFRIVCYCKNKSCL